MRNALILLPVALIAGCARPADSSGEPYTEEAISSPMVVLPKEPNAPVQDREPAVVSASTPQLAYDYTYGFLLPASDTERMAKHHQAMCEGAGVAQCQVLNASTNANPEAGSVRVEVNLRATPQWLKKFENSLKGDLKSYKARITQQTVTSEDLSLEIIDSEARLKNKMALRDRLQAIIRQSPGKIAELIEAETQLSQVQADIDSLSSSLAVMRKRVATSHLTLTYDSHGQSAAPSAFAPLTEALGQVVYTLMASLGFLVICIAAALPFAVVLCPLGWWGFKLWRKRKLARTSAHEK